MSAADVEGAVLNQVQKLLSAPDLVARTWSTAKRAGEDDITEREVTVLLADFATVWAELFPAEQARIVQLLVERGRRAGGRLTLLAPHIVERVMDGGPTAGLARLLEPFPVEWERQREQSICSGLE